MTVAGRELLVGGYDQEFRAVDGRSGTETKESKDSKGIINVIRSINSHLLVLGLDNGIIRFWDKTSWAPRRDVKEHKKAVTDIRVDGKGVMMVSVGGR
jgi:WD40 repeat protein